MSAALEFDTASLRPGENRRPCPHCAKGRRDDAVAVLLADDGRVVWHCHRCGWAGASGQETRAPRPAPAPRPKPAPRDPGELARLWSEAQPLSGVALDYLCARGCCVPPRDGDLHYHPNLRHPCGHVGPALVALVTHAETGEPLTLHRTWITATGKASVKKPRLLLGGYPKAGGVVRLWPDVAVTMGVGIAEGLETALSAARAMQPIWATVDAGNMTTFPVLPGVDCLTIFADHDEAGIKAAQACADRWLAAGRDLRLILAKQPGADFNDFATRAA